MQRQKRSDRLRRDSSIPNIFPFFSQVQELGLQEAYANDRGTHDVLRKLMALPFLPAEKIKLRFLRLQEKATTEALKTFKAYIQKTWITGDTFPPTSWSVYMQAVRTNNDLVGAQRPQQTRERESPTAPVCIDSAPPQGSIVSDKRLRRHQWKTYKKLQTRLFKLWHQYENNEKHSKQLLEPVLIY